MLVEARFAAQDDADVLPCLSTPSGGVNAAYRDCAGCGCQEGRTYFHGRGFAGAVRADQCHNLAGVNVEGYIVDGGGVSEAPRELACRKHRGGLVHSELHEFWESMGKSPAPEMMEINGARRNMPTQGRVMGLAAGQLTLRCELRFVAGISYSATQ